MKTAMENVDDLMQILGPSKTQIISESQLDRAMEAMETHDNQLAANVLNELFEEVAKQAGGLQLDWLEGEAWGRKIGWITTRTHTRQTMLNYLAQYKRDLAETPMKQAIQAAQDTVEEVVRESRGPTCAWCLDRCGVWAPIDANAYGVWARHAGCDCVIYVRKVKNEY